MALVVPLTPENEIVIETPCGDIVIQLADRELRNAYKGARQLALHLPKEFKVDRRPRNGR